jgi:hypothetical protein
MEQCQSLKVLSLRALALDGNHCRVLNLFKTSDRTAHCKHTVLEQALSEVLGRNDQALQYCDVDNFVLADGLRGNSRLKASRKLFSAEDSTVVVQSSLQSRALSKKTKVIN